MTFEYDDQNIFAKILRGEIPNDTVFESETALAFRDINPQAPDHVLVIPKGAYMSLDDFAANASADEQVGFMQAVAAVCDALGVDAGFRAIANTRQHGAQDVPHFHLHILAGKQMGAILPA